MLCNQLRYFIAVANAKSINKAAEHLYISSQALGESLRKLEKEVDLQLFIRSHSGIKLTGDGEKILSDSKKIIEIIDNWQQIAEYRKSVVDGEVNIVLLPQYSRVVIECMSVLHDIYPSIQINHYETRGFNILETLLSHKANIAVLLANNTLTLDYIEAFAKQNNFTMEILENKEKVCLCLNEKHPLACREHISLDECEDLILATLLEEQLIANIDHTKYFSHKKSFQFYNYTELTSMIAKSFDVAALVPEIIFNEYAVQRPTLSKVYISEYNFSRPIIILQSSSSSWSKAEKIVLEEFKKALSSYMMSQ